MINLLIERLVEKIRFMMSLQRHTLGELNHTVSKFLSDVDERERMSRSAVARLEADFVRRFVEFGKNA